MGGVVVDVRALQAHDHASRGIGRYTSDLAREVERQAPGLVRAYVVDPAFPLHERLADLEGTGRLLRSDDPSLERDPPRVLHVTSPFVECASADPPFLPRWADAPGVRLLATLYDLIPARFPGVHLRDPVAAARYRSRLQFLRSCDRLLAISAATAADAVELAGVPASRVRTVLGGAAARFHPAADDAGAPAVPGHLGELVGAEGASAGFVLCPTGIEWRKNLDRMLQAWALLDRTAVAGRPLVVQCHVDPGARQALAARCAELGIAGSVRLTGGVADDDLVALYRAADLVVFPSFYEGLGLPVLEARRCGAPVVVGDNSSLRELVEDPAGRFDALDPADIARVVGGALADPARRVALAAAPVPDGFDWPSAGAAVLEEYRAALGARPRRRPPRRPPRRPRLAVASPVPPQLAGPASYFARLVPGLHEACDLTVLTTLDPASVDLPEGVRVERLSHLGAIEAVEGPFDEVLYELGNSAFHLDELRSLRRRPGAVFLHDARLTLLYTELAARHPGEAPGGLAGLLHGMYPGRYPLAMGGAGYLPLPEEAAYGVLMMAEVARLATRLFVHSPHAADLVQLDCGWRPEVLFPIPCPPVAPPPVAPPPAAGDASGPGDPAGAPLVASFGFVSPAKRSEDLVDAVAALPGVRLALVGHSGEEYLRALRDRAAELGVADRVEVTGKVGDDAYQAWLARASVAVQLRRHSNGESSASVAEALAAGVPTLVSDLGTFADYPDDTVVKLPAGASTAELGACLRDLLADGPRRAALAGAGRRYAAANGYDAAAALLARVLVGPPSGAGPGRRGGRG